MFRGVMSLKRGLNTGYVPRIIARYGGEERVTELYKVSSIKEAENIIFKRGF